MSLTGSPSAAEAAQICAAPGSSGPANISGIIDGYYPGRGSVSAGATSIPVGSLDGRGAATAIAAGDLLVVIQIQDAAINGSNSSSYGGSAPGQGYTFLNSAGAYEYVSAAGPVSGGSLPITSGLINSYATASASSFQGQRTFQVIRVPQYSSAVIIGTVTAPPWNGSTGGIVALDVAGNLNWGGQTIDVNARGFRGGAAQQSRSNGTGDALASTDYVSRVGNGLLGLATANGTVPNGAKGEGIAGTPIIVFVPSTPNNDNTAGTVLNTGSSDGSSGGYPAGSFGRGAPGNAGGGGTDGDPPANDQNSGGGGGGNYGPGGTGGFGWTPLTPPGSQTGGFGGGSVPDSPSRLFFGGGGGAGTSNDGTTSGYGILTSGASGGGIVLVRTGTVSGSGTINTNGGNGNIAADPASNNPNGGIKNDASGGGGAGGSVLVFVNNGGASTGATINAKGGAGGNNAPGAGVNPHGPGGGGSGGYAVLSGSAAVNVAGGANGLTNTSAWTTSDYGSTTSPGGYTLVNLGPGSIPGVSPSPTCYPHLTVTKATSTPNVNQGGLVTYTITATNQSGYGTASGVTLTDTLPSPPNFTYAATTSVVLAGGATRSVTSNPAAGGAAPSWGTFAIPGGGSVTLTFSVKVAPGTPLATYQNPASVTYADPTATAPGQTVTPGGTYAGGGTVLGSNYDSASTTNEDVTVRSPASLGKSFNPTSIAVSGSSVMTIVVNNPTSINFTNAGFTDSYPAALVNAATPSASTTCPGGTVSAAAGGTSFALTGATVPANGSCQVQVTVTSPVAGPFTNTIPSGALVDAENITNVTAGSATLQARPTIAKSFSPSAVPQNSNAALTFTISNSNASGLTGIAFADTYPANLVNASPLATGGTCTGVTLSGTTVAGGSVFNVTAGNVPAAPSGSCTITVQVRSAVAGNFPNTTGGVTSLPTPDAGASSNTAALGVGLIAISKAFSPAQIIPGGTSTVTLTLTNPTGIPQTNGSFSDTLTNMQISATAVGGSCTGVTPNTLTVGQTALNFTGINIPAAGCTVTFTVTSSQTGSNPNTTSGVSTALLPVGPASNAALLTVVQKPAITQAFTPTSFQPGGTSTLLLTITNPNTVPLTGINFTDAYPANLVNAAPPTVGGTCSGVTVSATTVAGGSVFNVTSGTVPALSSCTISIPVTSNVTGTYNNSTSGVASNESGVAGSASNVATLNVVLPPAITAKSFTPSLISQNGISTVTFTLQNNNSITLTNVNFSDALTNMTVANGTIGGSCAGVSNSPALIAGATSLNLTVPALNAGSSCTITAQVTSSVSGANPNQTSGATSAQSPLAGSPSPVATLNVLRPPQLAKNFVPGQTNVGGTTTLAFNITNLNSAALNNVQFTDSMSNMTVASASFSKTCSGAVSFSPPLAPGGTQVNPTLTTLNANESCTISVTVTSWTISPAAGLPNTTGGATSTQTPLAGTAASASLDVLGPATIAKAFNPTTIQTGGTSTITFTLTNPDATALTGASFSDSFPAGLTTTALPQTFTGGVRGTCAGTIPNSKSTTTADPSVSFAGINIPANASCTVLVDVTAATVGSYINTVSGVTCAQVPTAGPPASATLTVLAAPSITKKFSPGAIGNGQTSTLTFLLSNPNPAALSGVAFSDLFPTDLRVDASPNITNSCGGAGTLTVSATGTNPGTVVLSGGSLAANGTCTITVDVTSTANNTYNNSTTGVTSAQTPTAGAIASDTLTVTAAIPLVISKTFSSPTVQTNTGQATLTVTITNNTGTSYTDVVFTDPFPSSPGQMQAVGGPVTLTTISGASKCAFNGNLANPTFNMPNIAVNATTYTPPTTGTGLSVPTGSVCSLSWAVDVPTAGTYANSVTGASSATRPRISAGAGDTAQITGVSQPTISKAFAPATIGAGSTSTITFTLGNTSNTIALSNATFTDTLSNMSISGAQTAGGTCSGASGNSFTNGQSGLVTLSGLTLPAAGTCTVTLSVTSTSVGTNANATSGVTTGQTTTGTGATSVDLTVIGTTLTKAFAPSSVRTGQASTLTFTLANGAGNPAQTALAFTDTFPANIVVANPANGSTTCGAGTVTGGSGSGSIALSNASMALGQASCTVRIDVVSGTAGTYNNAAANVTGTSAGMTNSVNATLTVYNNATMTKTFAPATIGMNGRSTLTFTIANGAGSPVQSGLGFTDTFPPGVTINSPNGLTTSGCTGQTITATGGTGLIAVTGVQVAAAPSACAISVDVTAAAAGSYLNNSAGNITALTGGLSANALASTLNVVGTALSKAFLPATQQVGSNSRLTLTITNGTGNPAQSALAFTDTLPAGLIIATPNGLSNSCAGAVTATANTSTVSLSAGALAAATANCTIQVDTVAASAGIYTNNAANMSGLSGNLDAGSVNAVLTYLSRAGISNAFSPTSIAPHGTSTITFSLANANSITLTDATFTDVLSNIWINADQAASGTCGGVPGNNFTKGQTNLSFSNLSIPPGGCTVSVVVTSDIPGTRNNTTSGVAATQTTVGAASNTAQLTVGTTAPTIAKAFNPAPIDEGGTSTITFTLGNTDGINLSGAGFTDTLANMTISGAQTAGGSCTGAAGNSFGNGQTGLTFAGLTIPANATCTVTIVITSSTIGTRSNQTSGVTSNEAPTGTASNIANLVVQALPTLTKAFSAATVGTGQPATLTFTITNPAGAPARSGLTFTDTLPANLVIASPASLINGCGGTPTIVASAGTGTFAIAGTGVTAAAGATGCTISVNVTSAVPAAGYVNGAPQITAISGMKNGVTAQTLSVGNVVLTKAYGTASIPTSGSSLLTFTLTNSIGNPSRTGLTFTDALTVGNGLTVTGVTALSGTGCSAATPTFNATANPSITLTGATMAAAAATCTFTATVKGNTAGTYNNVTANFSGVSSAIDTSGANSTLTVYALPLISILKSANTATANPGQVIVYTIQLVNSGAGAGTNVVLTDDLSPYGSFYLGAGAPFTFSDSSPLSGLTPGVPQYSTNNGSTWLYSPVSGGGGAPAGYDGNVTNWRIPMAGTIRAGGSFMLNYQIVVK